jgi:hypothetical protein
VPSAQSPQSALTAQSSAASNRNATDDAPSSANFTDDADWSCDAFDDDAVYSNVTCAAFDAAICAWGAEQTWLFSAFCGAACNAGAGAACAMELLNDLDTTCNTMHSWSVIVGD